VPSKDFWQPSSAKPGTRYSDASEIGNQPSTRYQALVLGCPPCCTDSICDRIKTLFALSLTLQELHTVEQSLFTYTHFFSSSRCAHFHSFDFQDTHNEDHHIFTLRGPSAQRISRPCRPDHCSQQRSHHVLSQPRSWSRLRRSKSTRCQPTLCVQHHAYGQRCPRTSRQRH
jgi:hypothetical protein